MRVEQFLDYYDDFPKVGIRFIDISRLLFQLPLAIRQLGDLVADDIYGHNIPDAVVFAGIESRGFIVASALAQQFSRGFMMVRKAGKLPGHKCQQAVKLEYGRAVLECQLGNGPVILCDDVVATGGTMRGAEKLLRNAGYDVIGKIALINISNLNDLTNLWALHSVQSTDNSDSNNND